ncbi:hypothetical protein K466DRAFT_495614 [Polyporus arcularius HHB13444]|uniref:Tyr recombinase domain-containing protein n=1 Tax=Polyporus arcularius HHB13444 TaxID=1314778 RepID=A0A5C3P7N9_9APHY|nr:hypothetical protein K466DRAFT_495614 [Polyporus arcularius HHB13444]
MAPPDSVNFILLDVGLQLVILALRQGLLVHRTLESLLDGREVVLQWRPEVLDLPMFCATTSKGESLLRQNPMRDHAHRAYLHKVATAAGLDGELYNITGYCMRRNFATRAEQGAGDSFTRAMMGHMDFTRTLHSSYSNVVGTTDLTALMIHGEQKQGGLLHPLDSPTLMR